MRLISYVIRLKHGHVNPYNIQTPCNTPVGRSQLQAGAQFEGDLKRLAAYAAALATLLEAAAAASRSAPVELLRKESLAELPPDAIRRVLAHSYAAVLPLTPLPLPALPLSPTLGTSPDSVLPAPAPASALPETSRSGSGDGAEQLPAFYGMTAEMGSPWLPLLLYSKLGRGPRTLVLMRGQRLQRLPVQLAGCTHAVVQARGDEI